MLTAWGMLTLGRRLLLEGALSLFHLHEQDLLDQWLSDPPLDGSYKDGRGFLATPPILLESPRLPADLQQELEQALPEAKSVNLRGRTLIALFAYGQPWENHFFVLRGGETLSKAEKMSEAQRQVVGYDVDVRAVLVGSVSWADALQFDTDIALDGLIPDQELPDGYRAGVGSTGRDITVTRRLPCPPDLTDQRVSALEGEVRRWLWAFAFTRRVGFRMRPSRKWPLYRRYPSDRSTVRATTVKHAISIADALLIAQPAAERPDITKALLGLNRLHCSRDEDDFLLDLWRAVEAVFFEGRQETARQYLMPWEEQIKAHLCAKLGEDRAEDVEDVWKRLCDVPVDNRNQMIGRKIAPYLGCGEQEACRLVRELSYARGKPAHSMGAARAPQAARALLVAMREFVTKECGLEVREHGGPAYAE